MTAESKEKFHHQYKTGKEALERGNYRLSIQCLEAARELIARSSRKGGEVQIWLVTAYQAAGKLSDAIALCQQLTTHPHPEIRKQAKNLLYIIQAPKLQRPKEWMTEIPTLTADVNKGDSQYVSAKKPVKSKSTQAQSPPEPIDLSQVNTQDNQFVWVALILTILTLGGLIWLG